MSRNSCCVSFILNESSTFQDVDWLTDLHGLTDRDNHFTLSNQPDNDEIVTNKIHVLTSILAFLRPSWKRNKKYKQQISFLINRFNFAGDRNCIMVSGIYHGCLILLLPNFRLLFLSHSIALIIVLITLNGLKFSFSFYLWTKFHRVGQ